MAMRNATTIEIRLQVDDLSSIIKRLFLSLEDKSSGERLNDSFFKNDTEYHIYFEQNHYSNREEVIELSKELAKTLPHNPFTLTARSWNEGSGGNYSEEVYVSYQYGIYSYRFYSDSEIYRTSTGDNEVLEPNLVLAEISQLIPQGEFVDDMLGSGVKDRFQGFSNIGESRFAVENGVLTQYDGTGGDVIIPAGVTRVGDFAFYNCTSLSQVLIPEGVKSIGDHAFYNCCNLATVTIPESVTDIDDYAFADCSGFAYAVIPSSVTRIGEGSFSGCESLLSIEIPEGTTHLGEYCFSDCSNLSRVVIPSSVTSIGEYIFMNCEKLKEIIVSADNKSFCSMDGVLFSKDHTHLLQYPSCSDIDMYSIPCDVIAIENRSFYTCKNLISVIIPQSVKSIGSENFYGCTNLTQATISQGVESIDYLSFAECKNLMVVSIPNSVTSIGGGCFADCNKLTLHVQAESIAEQYAAENSIPFLLK